MGKILLDWCEACGLQSLTGLWCLAHKICVRHDPKLVEINDNVFIDQLSFCLSQVASILTIKPKWYLLRGKVQDFSGV